MTHNHTDTDHLLEEAILDSWLDSQLELCTQNAKTNVYLTKTVVTDALKTQQKEAEVSKPPVMVSHVSIVDFFPGDTSKECDFTDTTMVDLRFIDGPVLLQYGTFCRRKRYVPLVDY